MNKSLKTRLAVSSNQTLIFLTLTAMSMILAVASLGFAMELGHDSHFGFMRQLSGMSAGIGFILVVFSFLSSNKDIERELGDITTKLTKLQDRLIPMLRAIKNPNLNDYNTMQLFINDLDPAMGEFLAIATKDLSLQMSWLYLSAARDYRDILVDFNYDRQFDEIQKTYVKQMVENINNVIIQESARQQRLI